MRKMQAESLEDMLKRLRRIPPKLSVSFLIQLCSGLQYAHQKGIIHRDINSSNIFVQPNDRLKILDFGLSCRIGTEDFASFGTMAYMAPEQIQSEPMDQRTDIYAMGITAFEMLTGRRPFPEKDAWAVMDMHINMDIPNPAALVANIPDGLCSLILKACARDLTERYQNMLQVIADLNPLAKELGLNNNDVISSDQKMATLFLLYTDEHRHILNKEMEEF